MPKARELPEGIQDCAIAGANSCNSTINACTTAADKIKYSTAWRWRAVVRTCSQVK
ncbi:hypothetical protein D3C76_1434780 [compost metagenome]